MLVRLQRHVHLWFKYTAALFYRDAAFVLSLRGDHWALELWSQLRSVAVLWNLVKCLQALTAEGSGCEPAKLLVRMSPWIFLPYLCFFYSPIPFFSVEIMVGRHLKHFLFICTPMYRSDANDSQLDATKSSFPRRPSYPWTCWHAHVARRRLRPLKRASDERPSERIALWDPAKLFCLCFQAERTVKSAQTLFHLHNPQVIISWDSIVFVALSLSLSPWTKAKGQSAHLSLTLRGKTFSKCKVFHVLQCGR